MTIRKILVPVDGTPASEGAVATAFAVAGHLAAHVEVLHVRTDPKDAIPLLGEGISGAMIDDLIALTEKEAASRAARAKAIFDRRLAEYALQVVEKPGAHGASAAWIERTGREDEETIRRGRLADLLVVGRPEQEPYRGWTTTLNAALFESGRPVLFSPAAWSPSATDRIGIAWNGSAEAARSMSSALPFLKRASLVLVFSVATEVTSAEAAREVIDYLSWHGIPAEEGRLSRDAGSVGAALLKACDEASMDLMVMGAYTHGRLRQMILGGVTRHVLEKAALPLLLAH